MKGMLLTLAATAALFVSGSVMTPSAEARPIRYGGYAYRYRPYYYGPRPFVYRAPAYGYGYPGYYYNNYGRPGVYVGPRAGFYYRYW
jgi:hypothetical protein